MVSEPRSMHAGAHVNCACCMQSLFRKDIFGKLPFMNNPQVFAADTISVLLKSLEQKIQAAVREPSAVAIGMLNNARYGNLHTNCGH